MTQRVIKFRIIYKGKINGYERLTYKDRHIFWEWMALDMNPDNGFERWTRGVYPANFEYIRNQFSGLLDKHGKEIYEHDIMALKDASGKIKFLYVVKFEDAKFVLYHLNNDYGNWGDLHRAFELDFRDYEFCIVGNIYTTPELIER